jgi:hypothetical protein
VSSLYGKNAAQLHIMKSPAKSPQIVRGARQHETWSGKSIPPFGGQQAAPDYCTFGSEIRPYGISAAQTVTFAKSSSRCLNSMRSSAINVLRSNACETA